MNYAAHLARRSNRMGVNAIREILKVVSQPGMMSLAGGIPAPESFPLDIFQELTEAVLSRYGAGALQYDPTEGFPPLRKALVPFLASRGIVTSQKHVLTASGSQSALDAIGMVLISKGERVAVESLQEGERLPSGKVESIEYYKEYPMQKKSYIQSFIQQLKKEIT